MAERNTYLGFTQLVWAWYMPKRGDEENKSNKFEYRLSMYNSSSLAQQPMSVKV